MAVGPHDLPWVFPCCLLSFTAGMLPEPLSVVWTNSDEIPNNGVDDDHNGFIDDVHGWDFNNNDNAGSPHVAIINEEFARANWPGEDPLGKRVRLVRSNNDVVQVIGVAAASDRRRRRECLALALRVTGIATSNDRRWRRA